MRLTREEVLAVIYNEPGLTTREIAERFAQPYETVRNHIKNLSQQGIIHYVAAATRGRVATWFVTEPKYEPDYRQSSAGYSPFDCTEPEEPEAELTRVQLAQRLVEVEEELDGYDELVAERAEILRALGE